MRLLEMPVKKLNIHELTEPEIDQLLYRMRYTRAEPLVPKAERKKFVAAIRARDEERVKAGQMTLAQFSSRWPLSFEGRTPEDCAKMIADRKKKLAPKKR
jgi:hypothetical protein